MENTKRDYCRKCHASRYFQRPHETSNRWECSICHWGYLLCRRCEWWALESADEQEAGMCEACAVDSYEETQRKREQRYLEDDRNWE